jgi:uncharacterized membrane protein HdeD (DUF308 family)
MVRTNGELMRFALARNWWSLVIRGLLGIVVGMITFLWPVVTLAALVFLFAGYALVDGIVSLAGALRAAGAHERWGALLIEGIVGILAALATVLWPAITALALVYVIAAWAIVTGIAEIVAAVRLRKYISGEWLLVLGGIASVIFGVLIAAIPVVGALVIAVWFGAYALVFGAILIALGFRLRAWERTRPAGDRVPSPAH